MPWDERLDLMTKDFKYCPTHCKVAAKVLDKLGSELRKRELGYLDDTSWPYHLVVPDGKGRWVSLSCGGFSKAIDIQQLKKDNTPDRRFRETRYLTPTGAANYILRRY